MRLIYIYGQKLIKCDTMKKEKIYQDIEYQIGNFEGHPIMEVMTIEEQKYIDKTEGMTVNEVINMNISSYRDFQSDC